MDARCALSLTQILQLPEHFFWCAANISSADAVGAGSPAGSIFARSAKVSATRILVLLCLATSDTTSISTGGRTTRAGLASGFFDAGEPHCVGIRQLACGVK